MAEPELPLRARAACAVSNLTRKALHLLGRGGTNLPGALALRLCPDLPALLARGVRVLAVSGTNGKTTTCRMIAAGLSAAGVPFFANRSGANLRAGVTAELAANIRRGRPVKRAAVLECDEAALKTLAGELKPEVLLFTNVFRDQLDRYGEVTHTRAELEAAAGSAPDAVLCLNADDSLVASLSPAGGRRVRFYGVGEGVPGLRAPERSDAPNCIRCGQRYEYDYVTYAHLGGFSCPRCGWRRPRPDVEATALSLSPEGGGIELRIGAERAPQTVPLPEIHNLYNYLAAVCALDAFGVPPETIRALAPSAPAFGRMERFPIGRGVTMLLVKNPAGAVRALDYLAEQEADFDLMCCLNDGAQDGRDVSWIWDVPLERLAALAHLRTVYVSGTRRGDLLLRLKHAGLPAGTLHPVERDRAFLRRVSAEARPLAVVPTYTAMMRLRPVLAHRTGQRDFWE